MGPSWITRLFENKGQRTATLRCFANVDVKSCKHFLLDNFLKNCLSVDIWTSRKSGLEIK